MHSLRKRELAGHRSGFHESASSMKDEVGFDRTALLTDLYELTMMDAYYRLGMERTAVFEFYVRRLPEQRNFLVAAGLEQVLDYLEGLRFRPTEIEWLESTGKFSASFLQRLERFRFTGDVCAMREGSVFFENEPLLRVTAPLPEAQLVESRLINLLHYQTLVASKAARCRLAAPPDAQLVDFGMRRSHGAEAACLASRASYIAGFDATATVEAGRRFGIPVVGTMAHSYIQAHDREVDAFANFARCHPGNVTLLIDTYDTARAARSVVRLVRELRAEGIEVQAVRLDSGDLAAEARRVRAILDDGGCRHVRIMASGSLDEYAIAQLKAAEAPVDAFAVGTRLSVSTDVPDLDCAYKLHEYAGQPRRKRSQWKESWPGARQVYRQYDPHGRIGMDVIACATEALEGKAMLQEVMVHGRRMAPSPSLEQVRRHCREELATLQPEMSCLAKCGRSPVKISRSQHALVAELDRRAY